MRLVVFVKQNKDLSVTVLLCSLCLAIMVWKLADYIPWQSVNFIIGLAGIPLLGGAVIRPRSNRALIAVVLFAVLSLLVPVDTFIFFSLVACVIWILESRHGKVSGLLICNLALMSPLGQYAASTFSFPIRLHLTTLAGRMLGVVREGVQVYGNLIVMNGHEFSVDPSCMGVKLILTALLCTILIIGLIGRQQKQKLSVRYTLCILLLSVLLTLIANVFRIVTLVYFQIPPGIVHELIGIVCLLVYVLLPVYFFTRLIFRYYALGYSPQKPKQEAGKISAPLMALCVAAVGVSAIISGKSEQAGADYSCINIPGYLSSPMQDGVVKLEKPGALLYIKPIHGILYTEHNPVICWLGSGYSFASIREVQWFGKPVFAGITQKGAEQLHTAWWYDNGDSYTNSQFLWRWQWLNGAQPFHVINVTTTTERALYEAVKQLLTDPATRLAIARDIDCD